MLLLCWNLSRVTACDSCVGIVLGWWGAVFCALMVGGCSVLESGGGQMGKCVGL